MLMSMTLMSLRPRKDENGPMYDDMLRELEVVEEENEEDTHLPNQLVECTSSLTIADN